MKTPLRTILGTILILGLVLSASAWAMAASPSEAMLQGTSTDLPATKAIATMTQRAINAALTPSRTPRPTVTRPSVTAVPRKTNTPAPSPTPLASLKSLVLTAEDIATLGDWCQAELAFVGGGVKFSGEGLLAQYRGVYPAKSGGATCVTVTLARFKNASVASATNLSAKDQFLSDGTALDFPAVSQVPASAWLAEASGVWYVGFAQDDLVAVLYVPTNSHPFGSRANAISLLSTFAQIQAARLGGNEITIVSTTSTPGPVATLTRTPRPTARPTQFIAPTAQLTLPPPTVAPAVPAARYRIGATCNDGTSSSATGRGACSHHGGVLCWRYSDGTCTKP